MQVPRHVLVVWIAVVLIADRRCDHKFSADYLLLEPILQIVEGFSLSINNCILYTDDKARSEEILLNSY